MVIKAYGFADVVLDLVAIGALVEIFGKVGIGDALDAGLRIEPLLANHERLEADITGCEFAAPAWRQQFLEQHGDGIWLLTGRAASAPYADLAFRLPELEEFGYDKMLHCVEMRLVAEEPGKVGRHRIQQDLELLFVPDEYGVVLLRSLELFVPEAFTQATLEYGSVCGRKMNATLIIDEFAVEFEISISQEICHQVASPLRIQGGMKRSPHSVEV